MSCTSLHKKYSNYHYCIVPDCKNTSIKTPEKLWIRAPGEINMRKTWLKLANKDPDSLSTKTKISFCEDHFDLENDMENYRQYKIMGSVPKIRMKPGCIPSRFNCQTSRKHKLTRTMQQHASKRTAAVPVTEDKQICSMKMSTSFFHQDPGCLACSECGAWVAARVYVCVQCVDARMCAACEPHAHASHAVVRLPSTRVYNIVRDLFESLQAQLNFRLRGLDDDAEDELTDDLDDDEMDQYVNPVVKKTKRPVAASFAGQQIMPHEASKVTFKSSPPASPMPTDETNEPMVTADDIKVEEDDYDEWEPLRKTATEGFMKITSDIVKSECNEGTVAESKLAVDVRGYDKYNEMNLSKCLENESEFKRVSNVTVVRKTKGNTAGINKPAVKLETTENTSIECAQANELGSQIAVKIKEEPTEDACTEQFDSTGFLVVGSPRSIKGEDKETS
ncbi:hypothetical protein JYU34_019916 [Plutella xylostella]|uniref:THAP-type domain-containing protein n=1 Tax=Plutella xylostella TaxID=51655 RepID=A0ABQ7PVJ3_PLUXY|nr:hypothetical protein JYU34_019916 [Plutella xylostella]